MVIQMGGVGGRLWRVVMSSLSVRAGMGKLTVAHEALVMPQCTKSSNDVGSTLFAFPQNGQGT